MTSTTCFNFEVVLAGDLENAHGLPARLWMSKKTHEYTLLASGDIDEPTDYDLGKADS